MTMTTQEFYSEADVIVELHKAYGNIIDWDKDERPINWGAIDPKPRPFPPASHAADHWALMEETEREGSLVAGPLSEMA